MTVAHEGGGAVETTEETPANGARRKVGRPTTAVIDRATVVKEAVKIVDEVGVDNFSLRKLAQAIGVNAGSLYHHFANKEEILTEVTMYLLRNQRIPETQISWQETFIKGAHQYRETLLEHPRAVPLLATRRWRGSSNAKFEHSLSSMLEAGVPENVHLMIMRAGEMLGLASALIGDEWDNQKYGDVPDKYPTLKQALQADTWTAEESFDITIRALVVGFETLLERGEIEDPSSQRVDSQERPDHSTED